MYKLLFAVILTFSINANANPPGFIPGQYRIYATNFVLSHNYLDLDPYAIPVIKETEIVINFYTFTDLVLGANDFSNWNGRITLGLTNTSEPYPTPEIVLSPLSFNVYAFDEYGAPSEWTFTAWRSFGDLPWGSQHEYVSASHNGLYFDQLVDWGTWGWARSGYATEVSITAHPGLFVPEPSTHAMLGLGLGIFGFAARRRNS